VATYLWADWKNAVSSKEPGIPAEEQIMIDLVVRQPDIPQQVVFDQAGDVPFANYDLTSIAFQNRGPILVIIFNTAGSIGSVGQSLQYTLFIDSDCNNSTGESIRNRGAEFQVRYDHESGQAVFMVWDADAKDWDWLHPTELTSLVDGDQITVSTPLNLIGMNRQLCWVGRASNGTANFNPDPPADWLPNDAYQVLTQYKIGEATSTGITGKLAIPLTNAQDFYDVHIFVLPDGQDITTIPNARQPNFRFDGQRLLLNHEGGGEKQVEYNSNNGGSAVLVLKNYNTPEDIYEYNLTTAAETQISSFSGAAYPFYNAPGNQFVFASTPLSSPSMAAPDSSRLYVQCGLQPPEYEEMLLCQNLSEFGMLVSAGKNEIQGSYPLWTSDHKIVYQGCTNSSEPATCGIYTIDSSATPRGGNHASPLQLTQNVNDIPSDTKGNLIAFTAYRDDNWEAYLMNLDGTNVRNLSNNSKANDGLPAISPDSKSVAFVSDRGGQWAVWVASVDDGSIQKLFDLPVQSPWGQGDRVWTNERISWGP
jgi:TolB protein